MPVLQFRPVFQRREAIIAMLPNHTFRENKFLTRYRARGTFDCIVNNLYGIASRSQFRGGPQRKAKCSHLIDVQASCTRIFARRLYTFVSASTSRSYRHFWVEATPCFPLVSFATLRLLRQVARRPNNTANLQCHLFTWITQIVFSKFQYTIESLSFIDISSVIWTNAKARGVARYYTSPSLRSWQRLMSVQV